MNERKRNLVRIFMLPLLIFMVYPIALGFKIYYAVDTNQPEIEGDHYLIRTDYNAYLKKMNTGNRELVSPIYGENDSIKSDGIKVGSNEIPFQYTDKETGKGISGAEISLMISRTATNNQDHHFKCTTDESGQCQMNVELPANGEWEWHISGNDGGGHAALYKTVTVP